MDRQVSYRFRKPSSKQHEETAAAAAAAAASSSSFPPTSRIMHVSMPLGGGLPPCGRPAYGAWLEFWATFIEMWIILTASCYSSPYQWLAPALAVFVIARLFCAAAANPAITFALILAKKRKASGFLKDAAAQLAGTTVAAIVTHCCCYNSTGFADFSTTTPPYAVFLAEFIATTIIALAAIGGSTRSFEGDSALVISCAYAMVGLATGPISGGFANPWRFMATHIFVAKSSSSSPPSYWDRWGWIWIIAPMAGGAFGAFISHLTAISRKYYADIETIFLLPNN